MNEDQGRTRSELIEDALLCGGAWIGLGLTMLVGFVWWCLS